MLIEVRTDGNIEGSEQSFAELKTLVNAGLGRFSDRIRRVDLHLSDTVGHKNGHNDKCCMIEARRDGHEPIIVTHQESTTEQAVHGAIRKMKQSVESALGKEGAQDHFRDHD